MKIVVKYGPALMNRVITWHKRDPCMTYVYIGSSFGFGFIFLLMFNDWLKWGLLPWT